MLQPELIEIFEAKTSIISETILGITFQCILILWLTLDLLHFGNNRNKKQQKDQTIAKHKYEYPFQILAKMSITVFFNSKVIVTFTNAASMYNP